MPDCDETLYLDWRAGQHLTVGDLGDETPAIADAHVIGWRVECGDGHVVLLPGRPGCPCDDQQGPGCPHVGDAEGGFDWSEEVRSFRPHDAARLKAVIARLGGAA